MNENISEGPGTHAGGYPMRGIAGPSLDRDLPDALSIIREIDEELDEIARRTDYIQVPHPVPGETPEKIATSQLNRELTKLLCKARALRHSL